MLGILIIAVVAAVLIFVLFAVAGNYFYNIAIKPGGFMKLEKHRKSTKNQDDSSLTPVCDGASEWWNSIPLEVMKITSHDGFVLQGYYIKSHIRSNRIAVLVHGYSGKAGEMAVYAKIYNEMGFDVFAPDNRGHGASDGKAVGMGWLDREDYLQWIELLIAKKGAMSEILLHGHSMGGAAVSVLVGEKLPPNVKGIISDCAYDSVKNVLSWHLKHMFKIPAFPIVPITSLICKLRAGYYFGEGDVTARVAHARIPILFIHGNQDTFVPFSMVYNLYNATDPSLREIWEVDGAAHIESIKKDTEGYTSRIRAFVERTFCNNRAEGGYQNG